MKLAVIRELAVGWLLTCLVEFIAGSPQRQYWTLPRVGMAVNNPAEIENRYPFRIDHQTRYQSPSNSPYESIDKFQIEQRNQPLNGPYKSQSGYDYEDEYSNQFRNDQESYYQSLLRATENPLSEVENRETITDDQESQSYYQDYLPLDDNESLNTEQRNGEINPPKASSGVNEKVKNSTTDQKIAVLISKILMNGDSYLPNANDLDLLNSVEDEMIAEASVPDEVKRRVRQVRGQQPGLLWTLARLAFEKVNDTKSAANQIGTIVSNNLSPDDPPTSSTTSTTTTTSSSLIGSDTTSSDTISNGTTTTTEAPFRLTGTVLQGIIRRNVKGLIRLFRIEWRDAVNESYVSVRNFQRDLGNQIRPYLADNPNVKL